MKGLIFREGKVCLDENIRKPVPEEGEVLIQVILAGICATDIEISKGYMAFEGILGHEFVGHVAMPGDTNWDGKRVVGGINCSCGTCQMCLKGFERHCPNRKVLGILNKDGVFTEYITLPIKNLVEVPDTISNEDAVYAEPLAAVLHIAEQTEVTSSDRVIVLGDGRLGLLTVGVGLSLGWNISLAGRHPDRTDLFQNEFPFFKADNAPAGTFDIAVDCTGSPKGVPLAIKLLKPQGRLVLKTTTADRQDYGLNEVVINEFKIIGSRCGSLDCAIDFLKTYQFRPSVLTSDCFPLSKGIDAFKEAIHPNKIKVLLTMAAPQ